MARAVKHIKDPVHGMIPLNQLQLDLINTPEVQRLSRVLHGDFKYLIYPGATHTRILHSLGVSHLSGEIAKHLGFDEADISLLQASGLLHDIGHPPFSHALSPLQAKDHEGKAADIITGKLTQPFPGAGEIPLLLERHGVDARDVAKLVIGKHPSRHLQQITASDLDADRMDYLVHDAHFTGAQFGAIDIGRLISTFALADGELCVLEKALDDLESFFIARAHMYSRVYAHHVSRAASDIILRAARGIIPGHPGWEDYTDDLLMSALHGQEGLPRKAYEMATYRRLPKRAYVVREGDATPAVRQRIAELCSDPDGFRLSISEASGADPDMTVIDTFFETLKRKANKMPTMRLLMESGEVRRASEVSDLIRSMSERTTNFDYFSVCVPPESVAKAGAFVKSRVGA